MAVPVTAAGEDIQSAEVLRDWMSDQLVAEGWITSRHVEAAFRAVPRHLFTPPGTLLETAYHGHSAPVAKKGADGVNLSSVSAPWLQAKMIAQAGIEPGMRVMEIGSGGYNAALLAEITGEHVVTVISTRTSPPAHPPLWTRPGTPGGSRWWQRTASTASRPRPPMTRSWSLRRHGTCPRHGVIR
jgi:Protein-L-isoaspartate(D-aspartate) O-methyltransferase (PCMT)